MEPIEIKEKYPELQKMTVYDVLLTQEYKHNFKVAKKQYSFFLSTLNEPIKRNPLSRLEEIGILSTHKIFIDEYCNCLDKCSTLSRELRDTVITLGRNIYVKTVKDLMEKYDKSRETSQDEKQESIIDS